MKLHACMFNGIFIAYSSSFRKTLKLLIFCYVLLNRLKRLKQRITLTRTKPISHHVTLMNPDWKSRLFIIYNDNGKTRPKAHGDVTGVASPNKIFHHTQRFWSNIKWKLKPDCWEEIIALGGSVSLLFHCRHSPSHD